MFNNELISHLLVAFIYFLIVSLRFKIDINLLWLWLGGFFGTFILDIDHLLYWFVIHPEQQDSQEAKRLWGLSSLKPIEKIKELYKLGVKVHESHNRLIFHTATFQIILLLLAFYVLTSSGNIFGSAFVLAVCLHLLKDEWFDYFNDKNHLIGWLFWQIREVAVEKYLVWYLIGVSLVFLLLTRLIT